MRAPSRRLHLLHREPTLEALVGETEAVEIIGKRYDLQQVVDAVRAGLPCSP